MVLKIIRAIFLGDREGEPPPTSYDYLPDTALLIMDESHVGVPQLGAMYKEIDLEKKR